MTTFHTIFYVTSIYLQIFDLVTVALSNAVSFIFATLVSFSQSHKLKHLLPGLRTPRWAAHWWMYSPTHKILNIFLMVTNSQFIKKYYAIFYFALHHMQMMLYWNKLEQWCKYIEESLLIKKIAINCINFQCRIIIFN